MSEGLNRATLLGNLGADPELRFTQSGTAVLNLRLATTTRWKDKEGTWQDRVEWHSVTVWGARAEALGKILAKGSSVYVEGEIRTSSYEKDGEKRYKTEIVADKVLLAGDASARWTGPSSQRRREDAQQGRGEEPRRAAPPEDTRRRADERHARARDDRRPGGAREVEDDFPF